jgi:hypothetical protein
VYFVINFVHPQQQGNYTNEAMSEALMKSIEIIKSVKSK